MRQLGFGDPAIRDVSHDACTTDGLANAVFCNFATTTFDIALGSGSETLEFGSADTHPIGCFPTDDGVASVNVQVNGDLGGGDDGLFVVSTGPCAPGTIPDTGIGDYLPRFTLNGGAGNDSLHGAGRDDVFAGGPGNDTIDGGAGNDQIADNAGTNTLRGGPGDDVFTGLAAGTRSSGTRGSTP